jgi:hypothetical protein
MARLEFFVVSEEVSIDQTTNQTSVFSILEQVKAAGFPLLIFKCAATALWCREPGDEERDLQTVLRITPPGGEPRDFATNFRLNHARHRIVQRIQGLPIARAGELRFEVLLNGEHKASHVVTVEQERPLDVVAETTH